MDPRQDYRPVAPPRVTLDELAAGLQQVGVKRGDLVVAHVSLSSLGQVDGGAAALVDALLLAVGQEGTLLVPRFSTYFDLEGVYDHRHPPPTWTGQVSDWLLKRPGAVLSLHPSHAVVAIGSQAEAVIDRHDRVSPLGLDSPFDRMAQWGGKVLLMGVNQRVNTTIHTGEAHAGVPYWGKPRPGRPAGLWALDKAGDKRWVPLPELPGDSYGFVNVEPFLVARGLIACGRIGRAPIRLMPGQALIAAVVAFLQQEPAGLLCHRPACGFCQWARQQLAQAPPQPPAGH
jgi:aminoglycoside 3-N-acetyltransferase